MAGSATLVLGGGLANLRVGTAEGRRRGGAAGAVAVAVAPARRRESFYEVLRVRETATAGEIKMAYRALAKRFHPDVAGEVADFAEINKAYATLSDPGERAKYDAEMRTLGLGLGLGFGFGRGGEEGKVWGRRWETDQCW
ncbi:DnaJ domain-containing protein [Dioscorea alata]|uniref:DnaJ domain-containing protein n=1 Tax=Dioscorea alata TaxID=55571 RepID=A0ACB7WM71_DIOAL|nr:DnaJ domain-containing protein [Dioscorea alata]